MWKKALGLIVVVYLGMIVGTLLGYSDTSVAALMGIWTGGYLLLLMDKRDG